MPFPLDWRRVLLSLPMAILILAGRAHASNSGEADRQYRFAKLLASREDLDRATTEFLRFIKGFPDDPRIAEVEFHLAYTLQKASDPEGAARILERWLQRHGDHELADRSLYWFGEALAATGKPAKAREAWRTLARRFPKSERLPYALDSLGWSHLRAGEHAEALARYRELRDRFPKVKTLAEGASRYIGECLLLLGRPKEALAEFDSLIARGLRGQSAIEARFGRAGALSALGRPLEAEREFARVAEEAAKSDRSGQIVPKALLSRASALVAAGNPEEALAVIARLERRSDRGSAFHRALYYKGMALEKTGRAREAIAAYEAALARPEARSVHGKVAWQLADLRYLAGDRLGAVAAYDKLIALGDPADLAERALYNSGIALGELDRLEEALSRVQKFSKTHRASALAADALYAAGDFLVRLKRYRQGAEVYREFLQRFPRDERAVDVRFRRGWCLSASGSFEAARGEFESLLKANPRGKEAAEAAFLLGEAARREGRAREAEEAYEKALEAGPTPARAAEILWALASIAKEAGRADEALALSRRLVKEHPESPLATLGMLMSADSALAAGGEANIGAALAGYRELIVKFPAHELAPAARSGEAWALLKLGKRGEALMAFRALARAHPDGRFGAEAMYRAAVILREDGDWKGARGALDELLRRHPKGRFTEAARFERALALKDGGDIEGAVDGLCSFERDFPRSALVPDALRELALAYYGRKDRKSELAAWNRILASHPGSPAAFDAHYGVAALAEDAGDLETAAREYARAAADRSRPEAGGAAFRRADCLSRSKRSNEAYEAFLDFARAFPQSPDVAKALARAGAIAMASGKAKGAERLFRRAEELAPGSAGLELAEALRESGKPADALKVVQSYLEREGLPAEDARRARLELALALGGLGRHAEAETHIRNVIRGGEDDIAARAQFALAESYVARKDLRAAERAFYELLLLYPYKSWQAEARFRLGQTNELLAEHARAREFYAELVRENPSSPRVAEARGRIEALSP